MLLIILLLFILLVTLAGLRDYLLANRHMERLEHIPPLVAAEPPLVSVIIPALNEEKNIETALTSVLALKYPRLEIIVLNDRSTDATPAILDRIATRHPRMKVIHIEELPAGWLGKNHALYFGAGQARGEFLLFADADVQFAPDTIDRAVARMMEKKLDLLSLLPRLVVPGGLLACLIVDSFSALITTFKPWLVSRQNSRYFIGVGAFNMVRRSTYQGFDGHRPIRLCPIDDTMLGRMVKEYGGRQECMIGCGLISVPIYSSVREMIRAGYKSSFAVMDYRLDLLAAVTLLILCSQILPFWGLVLLDGLPWILCLSIVAVAALNLLLAARTIGITSSCLPWFPVTPYLKLYFILRAVLMTLMKGGIEWRGTFYPLDELKRHKVSIWPWTKLKIRL